MVVMMVVLMDIQSVVLRVARKVVWMVDLMVHNSAEMKAV